MFKNRMVDFTLAWQKGWPVTWRSLKEGITTFLAIGSLVGLLILPIVIQKISPLGAEIAAWIGWGIVMVFFAIVIGLTPYRGQKEITNEQKETTKEWIAKYDDCCKDIGDLRNQWAAIDKEKDEELRELRAYKESTQGKP